MDVLRGYVLEKHTIDLSSAVDIKLHPGSGNDVFDIAWNLLDPAPVLDTQGLQRWRNCKTDLIFSSRLSKVEKSIVTQRLITD